MHLSGFGRARTRKDLIPPLPSDPARQSTLTKSPVQVKSSDGRQLLSRLSASLCTSDKNALGIRDR